MHAKPGSSRKAHRALTGRWVGGWVCLLVRLRIGLSACTHTHTHSPPGTYAPSAQEHACIFCAPGSATNNLTRATSCSPCEAGRASTNSAGENAGQNGCKICEPGKSSPFGQPKCSECQRGYYASDFGSTSCAPCTAGFFSSSEGSDLCEPCPAQRPKQQYFLLSTAP